ncbi:MAG: DUF560 domain-containing protein [Neisseriaceae bacterium]|nr:DUF560 domain-containing protein [Neisseriaceae bacterium]
MTVIKYLTHAVWLLAGPVWANEETSQRLWQGLQRAQDAQVQQLLVPEEPSEAVASTAITDGDSVDDLGLALYQAISQQRWATVAQLLPLYEALPEHDPTLVWFAKGASARARGAYAEAIGAFRTILQQQPDFLRAQLELARTLFEDQQNQEARALFSDIAPAALTTGLSNTLEGYLAALDSREGWRGSFSLGSEYKNNLNQSSQIDLCTIMGPDGLCWAGFFASDKIRAVGTLYEATLSKRRQISGHHGLMARGMIYGSTYRQEGDYNEANGLLYAGYHYRDARRSASVLPLLTWTRYGGQMLSRAYGLRLEWQQTFTERTQLSVDLERQQQTYVAPYEHNSGQQTSAFVTLSHQLATGQVLFGGADVVRKKTDQSVNSHQQRGLRLGAYQSWSPKFNLTVSAAFKKRQYDGYNAFLGAQRAERELAYTAVLQWPQAQLMGFSPSLTLKRTRVNSNAAYVYNYRQNEVNLKLSHYF